MRSPRSRRSISMTKGRAIARSGDRGLSALLSVSQPVGVVVMEAPSMLQAHTNAGPEISLAG
jgi:hypothetical protein